MNKPSNSDLRQRIEVGLVIYQTAHNTSDGTISGIKDVKETAIDWIIQAFIESLPEKKNIGDLCEFHAMLDTSGEQEIIEALGYNQALTDVKAILGGEK